MLWIAGFKLRTGEKELYACRIIKAADADKAREIAEKKAVINTYWDHPEAIWQFEWLIRFDDLRLEIMDDERDITEGLTEIAEREGLTNDYEAIRKHVNKIVFG